MEYQFRITRVWDKVKKRVPDGNRTHDLQYNGLLSLFIILQGTV